ncbi:NAD-dependent epimerase/dehydratase family protein [Chitinophaga nivalis]|uniref:NAD-dependent epimerase/dehydratase family protein n=1 Tax=Chitinophaga nivalis TaxID=2991709 RepID=A0ABT3IKN4_9BACT|nr:NAD-dependent epimerase/dehydratase family protein [Chitinophaga nivalis]MCW3465798.1 NAD-dependent epimerase/dehydratase family protein [Chitinophaga nivalis]MCW3484511.1 NAD-dependent epimerase/dehydratase family protein [Chitinophaga nivalis]
MKTGINVIITGTTGMVGEGVLHECLQDPQVETVLIINRRPSGVSHPKLEEIIHTDFFDYSDITEQLTGYNACFFCLGISSVGINADDYYKTTYTLTMALANTLSRLNPEMTFCYVSGASTDSTEKGRIRWARVKGKTENDLMKLPFRQVYALRPGFIRPIKGLSRIHGYYRYINWMFPIGRALYPKGFCTLQELGRAMIRLVQHGYPIKVIEGNDIIALAKQ